MFSKTLPSMVYVVAKATVVGGIRIAFVTKDFAKAQNFAKENLDYEIFMEFVE